MSPQPFINQMNRATSETQKDMADEEGLRPILAWIKRLCDHVIVMLGGEGLEFVWNAESVIDPTVQRENLVAYVGAGMMTRRRAAEIMGETLPADPMTDVLTMTTGQGVVRLGGNSLPSDVEKKRCLIEETRRLSTNIVTISRVMQMGGGQVAATLSVPQ